MIDELEREYANRFTKTADYRVKIWRVLIQDFFSRWVGSTGVILDLGCGWGEFINQIEAARRYGMDLNPESRSRLSTDVTFLHQDCSQPWQLADNQLDTIFTSNFFEHLPDKASLARTLTQAFRCLKPGGRLICLGPNIKFLHGRYWDFWDHYLPLTELALQEGCELAGFKTERVIARFLPYSMSQGFTPPLAFLRIYLRVPIAWRILGGQFLVIMSKPAGP